MNSLEASQTIEYRIDRQGLLIYVSDSWTHFALDNGSPYLVAERVIGQPLLSFVSDRKPAPSIKSSWSGFAPRVFPSP